MREFGLSECKGKEILVTKEGVEKSGGGSAITREQASKVRRGIAILSYVAQDKPDLAVMGRALSQRMANPTTGTEVCLNRTIRYLSSHPRGILRFPRGQVNRTLRIWAGSD